MQLQVPRETRCLLTFKLFYFWGGVGFVCLFVLCLFVLSFIIQHHLRPNAPGPCAEVCSLAQPQLLWWAQWPSWDTPPALGSGTKRSQNKKYLLLISTVCIEPVSYVCKLLPKEKWHKAFISECNYPLQLITASAFSCARYKLTRILWTLHFSNPR